MATQTINELAREACRKLNLPEDGHAFTVIRSRLKEAAKAQRHLAAEAVARHNEAEGVEPVTLDIIHQAVMNARLPEGA